MTIHTKHGKARQDKPLKRTTALLLILVLMVSCMCSFDLSGFAPIRAVAEGDDGGLSEHVIRTVSPNHVTFHLFDYWVNEQDSISTDGWGIQKGINEGHPFVFGAGAGSGPWNVWTGNGDHYNTRPDKPGIRYGEYGGIVKNVLTNGYPTLDLLNDYNDPLKGQPRFIDSNLQQSLEESLDYLFDPDLDTPYRAVYENVQGLLKYDNNGGYVYNSHENYAALKESVPGTLGTNGELSAGYFEVYDSWALMGSTSPNGQFFPFDGADEVFQRNADGSFQVSADGSLVSQTRNPTITTQVGNLNHFIGMTMETVFLQPAEGKIDNDTPMSFTFSGDDDVWIFIDNVLVSDLGGVHDECFTVIDFETGMVYTGLTPIVQNTDGTFSDAIPTLEELRGNAATDKRWEWYDRTPTAGGGRVGTKNGSYDAFAAAHNITSKSLKDIFTEAGLAQYQTWGDASGMSANTFDQNTQHELKMFYLERGAGASNLVLEFNMLAVPASGVTKTDQDGNPVAGAEFQLWPAQLSDEVDENGFAQPTIDRETGMYIADKSGGAPICTVETDANGHLNFVTENRKIISFQERAQNDPPELYYVLEESVRPTGYRSKGDISLYYSIYNESTTDGVLLSHNYWQTGAYTQAMLDVTLTQELFEYTLQDGNPVAGKPIVPEGVDETEYLDNGIIFAVPIKRMDMEGSLYEDSNFHALYGTTNTGWTLMTEDISDKASVLEAAKGMVRVMQETRQIGTIIAERNARQLFQVTVTNIPGDVKLTYPYLLDSGRVEESKYNIAFYFAPNAQTLDDVDPETIVRLSTVTQVDDSGETQRFERQYASRFYIANIFNRMRVQKLNYYGQRLADAEFTMYQAYSYQEREGYVLVEEGSADMTHVGLYRNPAVIEEDGTLKAREDIVQIESYWDRGVTSSEGASGTGGLDLDGALIFPTAFDDYVCTGQTADYQIDPQDTSTYMEQGEYVIYETRAPAGYEVNEAPVIVTVNDDGVFADAGVVNDGIRAGQYAGWILNSITHFATESAVDETLTFINTALKVFGENGQLRSPIEGEITWMNKYSNENDRYIFFAEDVGRYVTSGRNLYQFTDEGTPRLVITQNNDVTAKVLLFDGAEYEHYTGPVTVNKRNVTDDSIYPLQGMATDGTLAFWLRKADVESGAQEQVLDSVYIGETELSEGIDYHVYTPNVENLENYEDISGLFSVETLVQVFDQGYGSLAVTKETENTPEGSAVKDEVFHFRVYSVFENATKLIIAKTDANGAPMVDPETGQPVTVDFNGTLNVRLRQTESEELKTQDTATNIGVDFRHGEGVFYLQPDYDAEFVYIPENREHPIYDGLSESEGLVGLVETRVTLTDPINGVGKVCAYHVAFTQQEHEHDIAFEDGVGIFYRNPDYKVRSITLENGSTYMVEAADGEKGLTVENRIQYAKLGDILNVPVQGEVDVRFTESDKSLSPPERVVVNENFPPENGDFGSVPVNDGEVTVFRDSDGDGYKIAYSLSSNTYADTSVAQFALHSGQTITIDQIPAGATYYIYEYAVGDGDRNISDWDTTITASDNGEVIAEYRAAKGTIVLNAAQSVAFTNAAHVGQLSISKTVAGAQATADDRQKEFTFTLTLEDSNGNPLQGTYPYTGATVEGAEGAPAPQNGVLTLNANGSATVALSHGQCITITQIPDGATYAVSETPNDGYKVVVEGDTDSNLVAEGEIQTNQTAEVDFTNIKLSQFSFTKVAAEDHTQALPSAEFQVFSLQCTNDGHDHSKDLIDPDSPGGCWTYLGTWTSDDEGAVAFGGLQPSSQYQLVETKAPGGRVLPAGQWRITTDENNRLKVEEVLSGTQRPPAFVLDSATGNWLLPNMKPIDIPFSGGYGAAWFLLGGGLLMLAAAGIVLVKKPYGKHAASK